MEQFFGQDTNKMSKLFKITFAVLALFLLVQVFIGLRELQFIGSNPNTQGVISVSGLGEVFAVPDIGTFTYSVVETADTVSAAQKVATEKGNKILEFLKGEGVDEKDIKTIGYNIYPKYEYSTAVCSPTYCPPGRSEISGYEVSQSVEVKVRKTEEVGGLLEGVGSLGASNVSSLSFSIEDEEELKAEAREKAIKNAKEKADKLAKGLNVRLVRVISFNENSDGYPYLKYEGYAMGLGGGDSVPASPEIPTGENKITSNVTISYEIR